MQIRYINRALQRFDSTQVIPTQFVAFTLSVIIGSAVLYRDFESTTLPRALEFVGGCALTFFGVYLITSGRERDEADSVVGDEEQRIGYVYGERYTDYAAYSDEDQPLDHHTSDQGIATQTSTTGNLIDEDDLEDDHGIHTPRAHLSSTASSIPSISDASSLIKSGAHSPQSFPPNPWSSSYQGDHVAAEPATIVPRPETPPDAGTPQTKVLLRFPSAPGLAETQPPKTPQTPTQSPNRSSPAKQDTLRSRIRGSFGSKTPLALRFSPGPLLPPLSGGLSAVVADSLRRGEGSSDRRRTRSTSRKVGENRRRTLPVLSAGHGHVFYEQGGDEYVGSSARPQQDQFGGLLDRTSFLKRVPKLHSASRTNSQEIIRTVPQAPGAQESPEIQRGRSLSDTWSESLGRLGESLRAWKRRQTGESIPASLPRQPE